MVGGDIKLKEMFSSLNLPQKEFDSADLYLLQQKYVEGTMGGMDGSRWLTGSGVDFYEKNVDTIEITTSKILVGKISSYQQTCSKIAEAE